MKLTKEIARLYRNAWGPGSYRGEWLGQFVLSFLGTTFCSAFTLAIILILFGSPLLIPSLLISVVIGSFAWAWMWTNF